MTNPSASADTRPGAPALHVHRESPDQVRGADRYARQTAADRPGVAQPVPVRPVPAQPWGKILLGAVALFALLIGGWEWYWRSYGVTPAIAVGG